jgi:hypothetical protein
MRLASKNLTLKPLILSDVNDKEKKFYKINGSCRIGPTADSVSSLPVVFANQPIFDLNGRVRHVRQPGANVIKLFTAVS